ncbi:hypothetical protein EJ08DRAFT_19060 [Tothia fuscella]|uniref:Uncharacterized protein n=1 Tax=Tothia fuscella TaxID=1048955 RepID=A0A9P4U0T8_9PEZI|nr:hypothetical protein EJ08DRAFT_19060 [Tothia fuscella]
MAPHGAPKAQSNAAGSNILKSRRIRAIIPTPIFAKRVAQSKPSVQKLMGNLARKHHRPAKSISLFESLPYDIHCHIFSHLAEPLSMYKTRAYPRTQEELQQMWGIPWDTGVLLQHPLYKLAAICRIMRTNVENYCKHLLSKQDPGSLVFGMPNSYPKTHAEWAKAVEERVQLQLSFRGWDKWTKQIPVNPPYRVMWVEFAYRKCKICYKSTARRGTWAYMSWVCHRCDWKVWPIMYHQDITHQTCLRRLHFSDPEAIFPGSGLQPLPCAYENTFGKCYLTEDVQAMVEYVQKHDPTGCISKEIHDKKGATLVLTAQDGTEIAIDTRLEPPVRRLRREGLRCIS